MKRTLKQSPNAVKQIKGILRTKKEVSASNTLVNKPSCSQSSSKEKKKNEFFNQECLILAKLLLGQLLVRQVNGKRLSGFITETECYLGTADSASHTFNGKKTQRNEPMFMEPGTSYVYSIYGMYFCFNISSKEVGSCVLIRSLEPYEGIEEMHVYRHKHRKASSKELKTHQLCNGPSKLCQALNISKANCNKINMAESDEFWVEDGSEYASEENIVVSKRIGIESAGEEAASKPLRFYLKNNPSVSVRDRKAEQEMAG